MASTPVAAQTTNILILLRYRRNATVGKHDRESLICNDREWNVHTNVRGAQWMGRESEISNTKSIEIRELCNKIATKMWKGFEFTSTIYNVRSFCAQKRLRIFRSNSNWLFAVWLLLCDLFIWDTKYLNCFLSLLLFETSIRRFERKLLRIFTRQTREILNFLLAKNED